MIHAPQTVGVAPGTLTFQLAGDPGKRLIVHNPYVDGEVSLGAPTIDTSARVRWDLIGLIGGGSLIIALAAGLLASAID